MVVLAAEALNAIADRLDAQDRLLSEMNAAIGRVDEGVTEAARAILDERRANHTVYRLVLGLAAIVAETSEDPLRTTEELRQLALDILPMDAEATRERLEKALTIIETYATRR